MKMAQDSVNVNCLLLAALWFIRKYYKVTLIKMWLWGGPTLYLAIDSTKTDARFYQMDLSTEIDGPMSMRKG